MTDNLLHNGDFEPGTWTRDTHSGQAYGEIFVPEGWVAWWEEAGYRRPEMKVIHRNLDDVRVHSGEWAFLSFTFFGRQHAGLYQVVTGLEPGTIYRLSTYAHAWSSHDGALDAGHPHCSTGVGCGPVYIPEAEVPERNGDTENDAVGNFTFRVGVSFGAPDPLGQVRWGAGASIYNAHAEVPPLEFVAESERAVVYLKARSLWAFRNSDAYWDTAALVAVAGDPADPEPQPPDPLPPPEPSGRGAPRVQYARTYVLLPPTADAAWADAAVLATWDRHRYTVGGSADDAGIGDLDSRRVIAVNPGEWE